MYAIAYLGSREGDNLSYSVHIEFVALLSGTIGYLRGKNQIPKGTVGQCPILIRHFVYISTTQPSVFVSPQTLTLDHVFSRNRRSTSRGVSPPCPDRDRVKTVSRSTSKD